MIYRVWRIKNRITGRYLAAQREGGAIVYLVFLAEQAAVQHITDRGLNARIFRPCAFYKQGTR